MVTCSGSSYATELVNSFGASVATANGADVTITCDSAEVSAEVAAVCSVLAEAPVVTLPAVLPVTE